MSEHKTWDSDYHRQNHAAQKFWDIVQEHATEDDIFLRLEHLMVLEIAHAKEEGDFKNGICMHCDRCGRKKVPLGRVLEYGKFYPSVTRKFADGHTEETPATNEIKKALCIPCSKETWSSFEKGRADAQRETVAAAIEIIQKADGAFPIEDFPASRFGHQLLKEITTELRSLAPTPEQPPKEV